MRAFVCLVLACLGAAALGSCGSSRGNGKKHGEKLCDPGENIFCRCPGGDAGTKRCKDDGESFDECVTREGACPPIGSPSSSSAGGGSGEGGGPSLYLGSCQDDRDCIDTKCLYGYCTKDCSSFDECDLGKGECVTFSDAQFCMPACKVSADCVAAYGILSECGYATAIDDFPVTTCAYWGSVLELPPEGSDCKRDEACNLGNEGVQAVCTTEGCAKGCFLEFDCPPNTECSSDGETLGDCD